MSLHTHRPTVSLHYLGLTYDSHAQFAVVHVIRTCLVGWVRFCFSVRSLWVVVIPNLRLELIQYLTLNKNLRLENKW